MYREWTKPAQVSCDLSDYGVGAIDGKIVRDPGRIRNILPFRKCASADLAPIVLVARSRMSARVRGVQAGLLAVG